MADLEIKNMSAINNSSIHQGLAMLNSRIQPPPADAVDQSGGLAVEDNVSRQ